MGGVDGDGLLSMEGEGWGPPSRALGCDSRLGGAVGTSVREAGRPLSWASSMASFGGPSQEEKWLQSWSW